MDDRFFKQKVMDDKFFEALEVEKQWEVTGKVGLGGFIITALIVCNLPDRLHESTSDETRDVKYNFTKQAQKYLPDSVIKDYTIAIIPAKDGGEKKFVLVKHEEGAKGGVYKIVENPEDILKSMQPEDLKRLQEAIKNQASEKAQSYEASVLTNTLER